MRVRENKSHCSLIERKALEGGEKYKTFMMTMLGIMKEHGTEKLDMYIEFMGCDQGMLIKDVSISDAIEISEESLTIMIANHDGHEVSEWEGVHIDVSKS